MQTEKLKLLNKMSNAKTLELESIKQSLQQREMEIQELKSMHTKIEGKMNTEITV